MPLLNEILSNISTLKTNKKSLEENLIKTLSGTASGGLFRLATPKKKYTTNKKKIQLIVIGGSKTVTSVYDTENRNYTQVSEQSTPLLHSQEELKQLIKSIYKDTNLILLNFAFPIQPIVRNKKHDGKLIRGSKQHSLEGLQGVSIGNFIEQECLNQKAEVLVTNDITVLLQSYYDNNIRLAGIIGTGLNFGITQESELINLELGNFNSFEQEESTVHIDACSNNPGEQLWEKATSGKYLKDHFNYWSKKLNYNTHLTTSYELNAVPENLQELKNIILKSSAQKTAVSIAALANVSNSNRIVMEGSVFWKAFNYKTYVKEYVSILGDKSIEFIEAKSSLHNMLSFTTLGQRVSTS